MGFCYPYLIHKPAYHIEFVENRFGMWGIFQFGGKVLPGPMFVVHTLSPQAAAAHVVYQSFVGYPYFLHVLPISQGQLAGCIIW